MKTICIALFASVALFAADAKTPVVKQELKDDFLKIQLQLQSTSAQLEKSYTAQQKALMESLPEIQKKIDAAVGKLSEACGKDHQIDGAEFQKNLNFVCIPKPVEVSAAKPTPQVDAKAAKEK